MHTVLKQIEGAGPVFDIKYDIADQLTAASISLESIDSIIWSHHHVDHTGDPSLFPGSTSLIVGPGFKADKTTYPGYPLNPDAVVCQDAFEGRELIELEFSSMVKIGGFNAVDFFDDGSFYVLHAPGHSENYRICNVPLLTDIKAHDHLNALARTSKNKFVFLGADSVHHAGELRPSSLLPLPDSITPSPFDSPSSHGVCPGSLFESIHPAAVNSSGDYKTTPFYELPPHANVDLPEAIKTVSKMQVFDASSDVLVVFAHDESLLDILPFFPGGELTGWEKTNYKSLGTWRFLKDFQVKKDEGRQETT